LKPFDEGRFKSAIEKFIKIRDSEEYDSEEKNHDIISNVSIQPLEKIVVKSGYKIFVIPIEEVFYIEAQDDYVKIHSKGGGFLKQQTMKFFEERMGNEKFVRIHRSSIINLDELVRIEVVDKNNSLALMRNGDKLSISKGGMELLKSRLNF